MSAPGALGVASGIEADMGDPTTTPAAMAAGKVQSASPRDAMAPGVAAGGLSWAEAAADKAKRSRLLPRSLKVFAALTFATALVGLIIVWAIYVDDAKQTSLWFELSKVLMQVMGVVVLGAIFSAWVSGLTLEHQRDESDLARAHIDWQRDVEMKKDTRQREDDIRRELLEGTIQQYRDVKRARRRLRAARYTGKSVGKLTPEQLRESRKACRAELDKLIDAQLEFERLGRLCSRANARDSKGLKDCYQKCNTYLKNVFKDYEQNGDVPDPGDELSKLALFVRFREERDGFNTLATPAKRIMEILLTELERPLILPSWKPPEQRRGRQRQR